MSSDAAKEIVSSIAEFFSTNPVDLQWNAGASLAAHERLQIDPVKVISVIQEAASILHKEQNVLNLKAPIVVVGDIHGQCFDLLKVFCYTFSDHLLGRPTLNKTRHTQQSTNQITDRALPELHDGVYSYNSQKSSGLGSLKLPIKEIEHSYLFLGDYVDRGQFSTECALLLLALKVVYPTRIHLLRGNHESRCMTQWDYSEWTNFRDECITKYGENVYVSFMGCFDNLPLAALVSNTFGDWLCCHGGIGSKVADLNAINSINRFIEPPLSGGMCDLLWADPLLEELLGKRMSDRDYKEFLEIDYLPNPPRGCACFYGYAALAPFLKESNLLGIVRAHQCKEEGIHYCYSHNREQLYPFPLVTTVFSASNYCGTYTNKGAIMVFLPDDIQVVTFNNSGDVWVENGPYCPPPKPPVEIIIEECIIEKEPSTTENAIDEDVVQPAVFRRRTGATTKYNKHNPPYAITDSSRSLSVSYQAQPVPIKRRGNMRRKSMSLIRKGHTGEQLLGSDAFNEALEKDAEHEIHPGWKSIKRIAGAIGKVQLLRNQTAENVSRTDSDEVVLLVDSPTPMHRSISKGFLEKVDAKCTNQVKLLFDSIDTNGDGHLTVSELTVFASDLGIMHDNDIKTEVEKMVQEMDRDNNGTISLQEFTHYLTAISLLERNETTV